MSNEAAWCRHCHHMIWRPDHGRWLHHSDDDWTEGECRCAESFTGCMPEVGPVVARFARAVGSVTAAFYSLGTTAASEATGSWASLASTVKPEEKP